MIKEKDTHMTRPFDSFPLRVVLWLLISADLLIIFVHLLHQFTSHFPDTYFHVENDRSLGEAFQYVKQFWIVVMFCWLAVIRTSWAYISWSLFFAVLLIDDALMFHERYGLRVAKFLGFSDMWGVRAVDLGELVIFALAGAVLLPVLLAAYRWGGQSFRTVCWKMLPLLLAYVFVGIVLDLLHVMVKHPTGNKLVSTLEDGGEMIIMSLICAFVLSLLLSAGSTSTAPEQMVERGGISSV